MIRLQQVRVQVDGHTLVETGDITISDRTFMGVIGPNGAGKSSLLRAMDRLLPYEGMIMLDGVDVRSLSTRELAKRVAFLPQSRPVPAITVRQLIAHGRYAHVPFPHQLSQADRERIEYAANEMGLLHLMDQDVSALSGGERQRVYFAMMLAQDAQILLLDEPTTYLDLPYQLETFALLKQCHAQGKTILIVMHDLLQAFDVATDLMVVNQGAVVAQGSPEELARSDWPKRLFGVKLTPEADPAALYRYRLMRGSVNPRG